MVRKISLAMMCMALAACQTTSNVPPPGAVKPVPPSHAKAPDVAPPEADSLYGSYLAGRYAQASNDWQSSQTYLEASLKTQPDNPDLLKRLMILALGNGEYKTAFAYAQDVLDVAPEYDLAHLMLATDLIGQKRYPEALAKLRHVDDDGFQDFIAPIMRGWAYAGLGRFELEFPNDTDNTILLVHAQLIAKALNTPEAQAYLSSTKAQVKKMGLNGLLEENLQTPQRGIAYLFLDVSNVLFKEYQDETARLFSRLGLFLEPDMHQAHIVLGQIDARAGLYESAAAHYLNVPENSPQYPAVLRQASRMLEQRGETDKALKLLQTHAAKTKDVDTIIQIGDFYRREKQYEKALAEYDRAIAVMGFKVSEQHSHLLYARGITYERLGQLDKAEVELHNALKFRPYDPYILNYLGYSWAEAGKNLDEALELLEKAATINPTDGHILDSLGWVLYNLGRYDEALEYLERAAEIKPYDPIINDHLGDLYAKLDRMPEARFQWQRALDFADDETPIETIKTKLAR